MYQKLPYSEAERQIVGQHAGFLPDSTLPTYNTPVTARENYEALFRDRRPYWMPDFRDNIALHPKLYNNTLGRGNREDITDVFGVHWIYEPTSGGSISAAGHPLLEDVNDWRSAIKLPDVSKWDWAAAARENTIDPDFACFISLINGFWFERLISFMDFMPAAMALIDEDQTDAIKALFGATTQLACQVVDQICAHWPDLDFIEVHDDWGSQQSPFFSEQVAYELFVPFMKQFTDRVHAHGKFALLHSCGHTEERVQCYIDAGFDFWSPQTMNDIESLYDHYGDKIILGVWPKEENLAQLPETEQRAAARRFVDRFCQPGKPSILSIAAIRRSTPAFLDEVYVYSRKKYLAE